MASQLQHAIPSRLHIPLQVKLGVLKTNKPLTLYDHPDISYTTCMAARRDGNAVLSGHADGSLHVFNFDDGTPAGTAKFAQHSCPPAAMSWGAQAALVTGNDWKVPEPATPQVLCVDDLICIWVFQHS